MTARVSALRCFPLKGGRAWERKKLEVNTTVGVVDDRRYAIRKVPGDVTKRAEKFSKYEYFVCANTPAMAVQSPERLLDEGSYIVDPRGLERIAEKIGAPQPVQLQNTKGEYHLCDTSGPQVSIVNLATLAAFETFAGIICNPARFRMNVWITGLPAFAEYEWVDSIPGTREITVGDVRLRIDDVCRRCKAPDADPETGTYDVSLLPLLKDFMASNGYTAIHRKHAIVMGIYGVVIKSGTISLGDAIGLSS